MEFFEKNDSNSSIVAQLKVTPELYTRGILEEYGLTGEESLRIASILTGLSKKELVAMRISCEAKKKNLFGSKIVQFVKEN